MNYQHTGTIDKIGETQQISDKFRKRTLWISNPSSNAAYPPECIEFEATQDNCAKLDMFKVGEVVTVTFALRGRKYVSKSTGQDGVFTTLNMQGIQSVHSKPQQPRDYTDAFNGTPF